MEFTQASQPDADAILHTNDDVNLYVTKRNLEVFSPVLEQMFLSAIKHRSTQESEDEDDSSSYDTAFCDNPVASDPDADMPTIEIDGCSDLVKLLLPYCWPRYTGEHYHEKKLTVDEHVAALRFLTKYQFPFKNVQEHFVEAVRVTLADAPVEGCLPLFKKNIPACLHKIRLSKAPGVADFLAWTTQADDVQISKQQYGYLRALKTQRHKLRLLKQGLLNTDCTNVKSSVCAGAQWSCSQKCERQKAVNSFLRLQLDRKLEEGLLLESGGAFIVKKVTYPGSGAHAESIREGFAQIKAVLFGA